MLQLIGIKRIGTLGEGMFENTPIDFPHESKSIEDAEQLKELAEKYSSRDGVLMNRVRAIGLWKMAL